MRPKPLVRGMHEERACRSSPGSARELGLLGGEDGKQAWCLPLPVTQLHSIFPLESMCIASLGMPWETQKIGSLELEVEQ